MPLPCSPPARSAQNLNAVLDVFDAGGPVDDLAGFGGQICRNPNAFQDDPAAGGGRFDAGDARSGGKSVAQLDANLRFQNLVVEDGA